ncbi:hypothetical protein [Micromonospora pallida]|uniref:hypothetical protein n=1 Tax=Micromonospora pallida TaxID=145854 RepID=UPI000B813792|nr:hypothetical protein [Micromonospora pallida]
MGLDHDPDDPALVYTDITDRVHYGDGGQAVEVTIGRQDETAEIRPTEMGWALKNGDNLFTPRNPASPYYGRWEQGRRVQIAETVGGVEYLLGTGYLEIPDMPIVDSRSSQPVRVTAVDRLGRLESAPAFEGTLAEHIRAHGGQLVEWFPLSDSPSDGRYLSIPTGTTTERVPFGWSSAQVLADPDDLLRPADTEGPPGDDQRYARWTPVGDVDGLSAFADATLVAPLPLTVSATDTIAVSVWARLGEYEMAPTSEEPAGFLVSLRGTTGHVLRITRRQISMSGPDLFYAGSTVDPGPSAASSPIDVGRPYEFDLWRLVTARFNLATGLHELWVGADATASQTFTTPGAQSYTLLEIGTGWSGALAHVQVRVGPDATTMTRADHLAQHAHGYRGLERQTVAERVVTLAGYAGIPASEVDAPAAASTPLQRARLAGVSPAAALKTAAQGGQDTLITAGDGRITLIPRVQRYNQPVALAIPWGWISRRHLRYRPDRPVTDVTVTIAGGGSVRRSDRSRAARYGVTGQPYELSSAIADDAANLASWALAAHGEPRTRCPSIRINMLRRTVAERQQLLSLRVGDRIELTGMPPGSPEDVPHLIVQGIRHTIGPGRVRVIEFNTSPLLGPSPGVPPACPVVGDMVAESAIVAY